MFQSRGTGQAALSLRVGHLVDLMQLLYEPLLVGLRQPAEAGIIAQHPFLVLDWNAAMIVEPSAQVTRRITRISIPWISISRRSVVIARRSSGIAGIAWAHALRRVPPPLRLHAISLLPILGLIPALRLRLSLVRSPPLRLRSIGLGSWG
jgi:hypothetical protein